MIEGTVDVGCFEKESKSVCENNLEVPNEWNYSGLARLMNIRGFTDGKRSDCVSAEKGRGS